MRFLTAGDRALLVELDTGGEQGAAAAAGADSATATGIHTDPEPAVLYRALIRTPPPGTLEFVPAARTVLIRFDPGVTTPAALADSIQRCAAQRPTGDESEGAAASTPEPMRQTQPDRPEPNENRSGEGVLEIPVRYDGEDLDEIAAQARMTVTEVIARHSGALYTVAFCGFAPGFGYLTGLDPTLHLPRRAVPRTRVPAGSVAIADRYTAVYPHSSPGGWLLLGHTDTRVWDPERQPPALLPPGTRVRFTPQRPQHTQRKQPGQFAQETAQREHGTGEQA